MSKSVDDLNWSEFSVLAGEYFNDSGTESRSDFNSAVYSSENRIESDCEMSLKSDFKMDKLKGSENFYDWLFQMENNLAMKGHKNCITEKSATETTVAKETATVIAFKSSIMSDILVLRP